MRRLIPAPVADPAADRAAEAASRPGVDPPIDLRQAYRYPPDRPWLRANMVVSVDGATVLNGRSGDLSGAPDRHVFSVLRSLADVILVGARTVRVEGYGPPEPEPGMATWRLEQGQTPAPAIAVVSANLDLDPAAPLFAEAITPTIVVTCENAPADRRSALADAAEVLVAGEDRVDLGAAVDALAARGHRRLLCEGGPHLLGQLVAAGCLDELCLTTSPLLARTRTPGLLAPGPDAGPPAALELAQLLEQDGFLFARYLVGRADPATAYPGR